jgi:hypothetical protein
MLDNDSDPAGLQCHDSISLIYFDHKIANSISIFQKFLNFGIYPVNNDDECFYTQLIKNCDNKKIFDSGLCKRELIDIPYKDTCPQIWYKTLIYNIGTTTQYDKTLNICQLINTMKLFKSTTKKYLKYKKKYLNYIRHNI